MRRRIVVMGATGRTGRLVAGELAGTDGVVLLGRSPASLEEVGATTRLPTRTTDVNGLPGALIPGDVLLNCVGPYDLHGDGVVRSAIRSGVTYLDVSGEPAFLGRLHGDLGAQARAAGIALLPAVGYEYLPGLVLAEQALARVGPDGVRVEVAYLADGGLQAGSAGGRRSLIRALGQPTSTFRNASLQREAVGARRSTFVAAGRRRQTMSLGGLEVWALPGRHPALQSVDVHTGWFGSLAPAVSATSRVVGLARRLPFDQVVDQLVDRVVAAVGDGPEAGLGSGTSRFVARVLDGSGRRLTRIEAVAGNPIVLAARLAAAVARALADRDLRGLPPGVTDPVAAFGLSAASELTEWAGVVTTG